MLHPRNIAIEIQNLEDTAVIVPRRMDIRSTLQRFDFSRPDSEEHASRQKVTVNVMKRSKTQEIQVNFKKFLTNLKCGCDQKQKMLANENKANCGNCGQFYAVIQVSDKKQGYKCFKNLGFQKDNQVDKNV